MQIVIDIPEEQYNILKDELYNTFPADMRKWGLDAIRNGKPLPEHHGDLVDKGDVLHDIDCDEEMRLGKNIEWVREVIRNAPTVIEATENTNKEESK